MIAALYVDGGGPYPMLPDVDCWDAARDARLYAGPHAVVAHPPCGPWGRLRHASKGAGKDCAPRAVEQVRQWGGVLEHPECSALWAECGLPSWRGGTDTWGGYTVQVDQCEWGHDCRKRTWLYLVGVPREALEAPPFPGRKATHCVSRDATRVSSKLPRANARTNILTPPLFAEYLVRLARSARRP